MKRLSSWLSTLLMLIPAIVVGYVYYPVLVDEISWQRNKSTFQQNPPTPASYEFGIMIPAIGVNERVVSGVDPFDKAVYDPVLQDGVAHAQGTPLPDEPGTTYIFGHSSDNPLAITRYNTSFFRLSRLKQGDMIEVYFMGLPYRYQVENLTVVNPDEVEWITTQTKEGSGLILQTCTPLGTSLKRLLVYATPVSMVE